MCSLRLTSWKPRGSLRTPERGQREAPPGRRTDGRAAGRPSRRPAAGAPARSPPEGCLPHHPATHRTSSSPTGSEVRVSDYVYSGQRQPTREVTRTFGCPRCGAAPGVPCSGRRGLRKSHHLERVEVALDLRPAPSLHPDPDSLPDDAQRAAVTEPPGSGNPAGVDSGEASVSVPGVRAGAPLSS